MIFIAARMILSFSDSHTLTAADGAHLHAALLHAISDVDGIAGQKLHDIGRHKRFTGAIIASQQQLAVLRVTFMVRDGADYASLLIDALSRSPMLRLGKIVGEVSGIDIATSLWSGISTWADIIVPSNGRRLHFDFTTPTAIAKQGEKGVRFFSLLPDPLDVFSGLARRWQALEGPPLPDDLTDYLKTGGCVISNHHLQTIEFRTSERTQIGFVGSVTYECRKSSHLHLEALQALARLAFFTGVGYQTARGMGLTRTSITE